MEIRKRPPASTPEGRQNELISLAVDLAEKQIREGTASSQVLVHFLKLGTQQAKLETEKLERENALLKAKTNSLENSKQLEELYTNAINAMKSYSVESEDSDDEE